MKQALLMLTLVGVLTVFAAAQEKATDSVQGKTEKEKAEKEAPRDSSSRQKRYLDARERNAAILTFAWRSVRGVIYEKKRLLPEDSPQETPLQLSEGVVELDAERVLVPDLWETHTILRTPNLSCIRAQKELPKVGKNTLGKSERPLLWDYYYLGDEGKIVISVFRGFLGDTDWGVVHVGYADRCSGFGLPSPFLGPSVGVMIFLGGISPFRLLGAEIGDWKLIEVNEEEWVFELKIEEARRKHFEGLLPSGEQVRFHLSRNHGDAPLRLEFRSKGGYEKWETLAFTQVRGAWMPRTVMCEMNVGGTVNQTVYELQNVSQTAAVELDIPRGTPVLDWRPLGLELWRKPDEEKSIKMEWSPELLSSLWLTLHKEKRD